MCINIYHSLFRLSGPYWTHILFTWTKKDGLKVYINGTFSAGDPVGVVADNYGDTYPDLVIGTGNNMAYGHFVTGAFDEFVIWERALSPDQILLYYNAAIGRILSSLRKHLPSLHRKWHIYKNTSYVLTVRKQGLKSNIRLSPQPTPSMELMHGKILNDTNVSHLHSSTI